MSSLVPTVRPEDLSEPSGHKDQTPLVIGRDARRGLPGRALRRRYPKAERLPQPHDRHEAGNGAAQWAEVSTNASLTARAAALQLRLCSKGTNVAMPIADQCASAWATELAYAGQTRWLGQADQFDVKENS